MKSKAIAISFSFFFLCHPEIGLGQDNILSYNFYSQTLQIFHETEPRLISRPQLQDSVLSPWGKFVLHFDLTGENAVPSTDLTKNGDPVETYPIYFMNLANLYGRTVSDYDFFPEGEFYPQTMFSLTRQAWLLQTLTVFHFIAQITYSISKAA